MYTLVFDTTGNGVAIALGKDGKICRKIEKFMEFGQAEELAIGVDSIIKDEGISFLDIGLLGVCSGPGSFTGVRASLAFARGLALANENMMITGVSAFEVYAKMLKECDRASYNAVVIETKREDFYFQLFDEKLNKITEPTALTREEISQKLKNHQTSFIGDGVERLLSVSMGLQVKKVEIVEMMDVKALFDVVCLKYLNKTLDFPKPLYIREAQTCVK